MSIHISNLHAVSPGFPVFHLRLRLPSHFTSAFLRSLSIYLSIYHSISLSPAFSRSINFMAVVAPSLLAPKQLRRQLLCFGSCSKICCMCFLLSSSFFALFASLLFSSLLSVMFSTLCFCCFFSCYCCRWPRCQGHKLTQNKASPDLASGAVKGAR